MNRNVWATQGRLVIAALKRRPMTYAQMLALGAGLSPWKRCTESLRPGEMLVKTRGADRLIRWRVVRAA